jgi:hypothetical protein
MDKLISIQQIKGMSNPIKSLVDGSRVVHRRFLTFSARPNSGSRDIHEYLIGRNAEEIKTIRHRILKLLSKELKQSVDESDVLFDVPKAAKSRDNLKPLFVRDPEMQNHHQEIRSVSGVVGSLCTEFEILTKKSRIYISDTLRKVMDKKTGREEGAQQLVNELLRTWRAHIPEKIDSAAAR